ncbi:peptidylprolyl isomerase [bacterium]|nr:peptidylprolyl isomerase [bacterium]
MKKFKLLVVLLFAAFIFTGCGLKNNEAIVKVNDRVITQDDYDKLFNQTANNPALQMFGLNAKKVDKKSFMYTMIKDKVVNELIIRALLEDEIQKRHIVVTKQDADEALNKAIEQVGSKAKFNAILKEYGVSLSEFKKDLVEEVKMKKLIDMLEKVNISDADAKKYYNQNISKFTYPDKVRASHILIAANPEEIKELAKAEEKYKNMTDEELNTYVETQMQERLKKAESLLAQVKKDPSSFAKVAKENSEDVESAKQGGDLGFFAKQEMVETFANTAFSMKPDTISNVVKSPYGYHIIMVTDRKEAGQDSFEKVKNDIILYLENEKKVKILENFVNSLKKTAKIEYVNSEYNPTDIKEILKQQAKENSSFAEQVDEANHSATPAPEKK